ncbi:hypothetical protein [Lutibacter sp.]|uniref:hypothetical protein n=1 Tax=Lutibacter sp. TaxID=1925666 RepID=UPI001A2E06CC|nr:hypothetical protein [Lutibacter sp.]MBI9040273.1 hypothetical protein [Lutibacter sp.]
MSFFKRDLNKEQVLGKYLDEIYLELNLYLIRINDLDLQHRGVDLIYEKNDTKFYIDEKAQLDYVNSDLPTFTFELSYLKNNYNKLGWLIDDDKITTHYFLITGIYANDEKDLSKGISKCKITSVDRKKLIDYLNSIGLTQEKLFNYQTEIRASNKKLKKTAIAELNDKTQGCLFYSNHLKEEPINLQLRLKFLIEKNIAKTIYPKIN